MNKKIILLFFFVSAFFLLSQKVTAQNGPGIFDGQDDVGRVRGPGSGRFDAKTQEYQLSGSGTNVWANHDEFHYVWKKMKGDFILRTNAAFIGKGVEEHRKVGWMIRSSLDTGS